MPPSQSPVPDAPRGITLTAGTRLARWLQDEHERQQVAAGQRTWEPAPILPLEHWLARMAAQCGLGAVLKPEQEHLLWEQALAASSGAEALLDRTATARAAAAAWRLAWAWQLDPAAPAWQESEDSAAFQDWSRRLRQWCREGDWITRAELMDRLGPHLRAARGALPEHITLRGFDELTPQQRELAAALRAAGTTVTVAAPDMAPAAVQAVAAEDAADELARAAAWAAALVQQGEAGPIGIVVPDLQARREAVERSFRAALHPGRAPWTEGGTAFHLSLGEPLERTPMTAAALLLLEAAASPEEMDVELAAALLRCPYWHGADADAAGRARAELKLRGRRVRSLTRGELAGVCGPATVAVLRRAWQQRALWPRRQNYLGWAQSLAACLAAWGWPGERALGSGEYQCREAWEEGWSALSRLDQVAPGPVEAGAARARLRQWAQGRLFQPRAQAAPVQIMGWLEASGLRFRHLWVLGLHDGALPGAAAPHPFLPLAWQRELGLPRATPARELEFAQRLWLRLRQSAPSVMASYPRRDGDLKMRPSPLLEGAAARDGYPPLEPIRAPAPEWETIEDNRGPELGAEEPVHGGSSIFAKQSACEFQAFATLRLHAAAWEEAPAGLAAVTRGNLLHHCLQLLWSRLQSQAGLAALDEVGLAALAAECAATAVSEEPLLRGRPGLAALEHQRLVRCSLDWLEIERRRPPFAVAALEQERRVEFGGLEVRLKLDRVDRLADGRRLLLDYKSGSTTRSAWDPPRPTEPQLPLYLLSEDDRDAVAGIAFAQLKPGELSLKAVTRAKGYLERATVPQDWSTLVEAWDAALRALAAGYRAGAAAVQPRSRRVTCRHCHLGALCRIAGQPATSLAGEDAGEEDGGGE